MNVPMWNSGPEFRNTYAVVDARPRRHEQALRDRARATAASPRWDGRRTRPCRSTAAGRRPERRRRDRRSRRPRRTSRIRRRVSRRATSQRAAWRRARSRPARDRVADLLVLPDDDGGREVVDDERELVGLLAPVRRAEHRADLAAREQAAPGSRNEFWPSHSTRSPGPTPAVAQRVRAPVHPGAGSAQVSARRRRRTQAHRPRYGAWPRITSASVRRPVRHGPREPEDRDREPSRDVVPVDAHGHADAHGSRVRCRRCCRRGGTLVSGSSTTAAIERQRVGIAGITAWRMTVNE